MVDIKPLSRPPFTARGRLSARAAAALQWFYRWKSVRPVRLRFRTPGGPAAGLAGRCAYLDYFGVPYRRGHDAGGDYIELPPVTDAVTARRSEQAKKAAEVEPGLQAKIEITQIYNDAREKGLTDPCGALIIETCKSLGFPRFSAVPVDRLPELVAAFSAAVTARLEG